MASKEGGFGLKHIFMTAAISVAATVLTGYIVDPSILAYSHFSEAGLAQTQITQHVLGDFNKAISDFMMTYVMDPLREAFGIVSNVVDQTANGIDVIEGAVDDFTSYENPPSGFDLDGMGDVFSK